MKCQKCGKNEVNFHYSSNINGCITETRLCSFCAAEEGYDVRQMFDMESVFNGMFPVLGGIGGFIPTILPVTRTETNVKVDDEMRERRELNVQMRAAVENEDYEKAAGLRDKIRELERREESL